MYSCNDCNGWDDSASTISSSPSQIVRGCNNYNQDNCNGSYQNSGVYQINLGNRGLICGEMGGNSFGGNGGCCDENESSPCDDERDQFYRQPENESALSRRKRYSMRTGPSRSHPTCMPPTIPVTEYQEAYQKCYRNYQGQGPGSVKTNNRQYSLYCRPPWNSSLAVPLQPFEESLDSAEAKLRLLDMFGEGCPMDMMFLEIKRDRVTEAYRQARSTDRREFPARGRFEGGEEFEARDTCGGGCGEEYKARPTFDGAGGGGKGRLCQSKSRNTFGGGAGGGGGGESRAFMERPQQSCSKRQVVLLGKPSRRQVKKKCKRRQQTGVYMNGSQLELLETESVLSHDADEVLNDMWKKLESSSAQKFQCHLKPQDK